MTRAFAVRYSAAMAVGSKLVATGLLALGVLGVALVRSGPDPAPLATRLDDDAAAAVKAPPEAATAAITDRDAGPLARILAAEADAIVEPGPATAELRARLAPRIADLADDGIRGNAMDAVGPLLHREAVPLLFEALDSRDLQQRQLAAALLRMQRARTTPRLAEVLVESFDGSVDGLLTRSGFPSARATAVRHLYHHPGDGREPLRRALWSQDATTRFLAAFLLACDRDYENRGPIVRELVARLGDNDVTGDAMMAAHALYRMGPEILPSVTLWRSSVDEQAQQLIDLLVLDFTAPPRSRADFHRRSGMHGISRLYHDPLIEYDIDRSPVAWR